jgi:hypothetical protein
MENTTLTLVLVIVAIAIVVGVVAWLLLKRRRSQALRDRFGPEYDRTVNIAGEPAKAEVLLEDRARRVEGFNIRPLAREDSARYVEQWRRVQARFVDDPPSAIGDADRLIAEVMQKRGYPVENFEQRADDLSVHYAGVVHHYRAGREIVVRRGRGEATTEDLRQAMVHFRALFDELVEGRPTQKRRVS